MNTLLFLGLIMCVFAAYTTALPYPNKVVAEAQPKMESLGAIDTKLEGESLHPAESAWGGGGGGWGYGGPGLGLGYGGYGGGWGYGGGGGGWGYGGGWGHHGHGHHHHHHHHNHH